jgi:Peptidase family M41
MSQRVRRRAFSQAHSATSAREAIAYHEAGHAVISMKLGYRCLYVTIIPDGDRLGHVCCEDPMAGGHNGRINHALKVLIAASLSEGKHVGGSRSWGDADDRVKATNLALLATDHDTERAEALVNEMIGETRKLVERHWCDIEALAKRVLIKGTVNFLETEAWASEDFDSW